MELAVEALTKAIIVMAPGRVTFARVDSSVEFQAEFTVDPSHNSYPALTGQAYIDNSANPPHIEATKKFVTEPKFQNSNQPTSSYHQELAPTCANFNQTIESTFQDSRSAITASPSMPAYWDQ